MKKTCNYFSFFFFLSGTKIIFNIIYGRSLNFNRFSQNMLFPLYLFLNTLPGCQSIDLTYNVTEGKSSVTYVGDIAADSNIMSTVSAKDRKLIRFSQLRQEGSQLFNERGGKLYTSEILDAESLCKYNRGCYQMLDIAVQKGTSSIKILEVKVIIHDVNDNEPEFADRQTNIEFSELYPKGTRIIPMP